MSKFTNFLRAVLPVKWVDDLDKVPASVQADIDKINKSAASQVSALKVQHSVATKKSDVATRRGAAAAVFNDYERMLAAEEAAAEQAAANVLPPLPPGVTTP